MGRREARRKVVRISRAAGIAIVSLTVSVRGGTATSFVGPSGSVWGTVGNWSNGVPDAGYDADIIGSNGSFPAAGTVLYNTSTAATVNSININNAALQVVSGSTLSTASLNVAANASYNQSGGTLVTGSLNSLGNFNWTGGVVQITAGSMTIKQGVLVQSWGQNDNGQLGNGTTIDSSSPLYITGLSDQATSVSAGGSFALALQDGTVYAWGYNRLGQLGNDSRVDEHAPTVVAALSSGVSGIAAGYDHSFAIQNGGAVAWGFNAEGDLGDGSSDTPSVPVPVTGLSSGVTLVTAGAAHSLALQNGKLFGWGFNLYGQADDAIIPMAATPQPATGLSSGVTAIAAGGAHSLVIQKGAALAFGENNVGQLGNGTTTDSNIPAAVTGLSSGVTSIAAGAYHSLAVQNGAVYSWGYNADGQLGNGTTANSPTPVAVGGITGMVQLVAAGENSSFALGTDGTIWDWGSNADGQLGLGSATSFFSTPQHLLPPAGYAYSSVSASYSGNFVLATLTATGRVSESSLTVGPTMTLEVTGAGQTVNVAGSLNLDGGTVSATALTVFPGGAFNWSTGTLTACPINISAGAVANLINPGTGITVRTLGPVNVGGNLNILAAANQSSRQLVQLAGLSIAGMPTNSTGRVDLSNNDLDIAAGGSTLASVTDQIAQGYNLGGGGNWQGTGGITSSTAAANTAHLTALGVIQNNQSGTAVYTAVNRFDGTTPGASDILVKYTYFGDANLDGVVDGSDYSLIDAGYASNGTLTGWLNGDFNYDGVVDGSDYALIDNAFNNQSASLSTAVLVGDTTAQPAGPAAVPEPTSIAAIAFTGLIATRRRAPRNGR